MGGIKYLTKHEYGELKTKLAELEAVVNKYLDFAQDVKVSPTTPELYPIREEMRRLTGRKT